MLGLSYFFNLLLDCKTKCTDTTVFTKLIDVSTDLSQRHRLLFLKAASLRIIDSPNTNFSS